MATFATPSFFFIISHIHHSRHDTNKVSLTSNITTNINNTHPLPLFPSSLICTYTSMRRELFRTGVPAACRCPGLLLPPTLSLSLSLLLPLPLPLPVPVLTPLSPLPLGVTYDWAFDSACAGVSDFGCDCERDCALGGQSGSGV